MDPNANLMEQRRIASQILDIWDHCADDGTLTPAQTIDLTHKANRLAELVEALDGWISAGGFVPDRWHLAQKGAAQ